MANYSTYANNNWTKIKFITQDWCTNLQNPENVLISHRDTVQTVEFNPYKKNELFTGGHDKVVKKWDLQKGQITDSYTYNDGGVWNMIFMKSGKNFFTCQSNGEICNWEISSSKKPSKTLTCGFKKIFDISLNSDETQLACCGVNNSIDIYDLKNYKLLKQINTDSILTYNSKFHNNYLITSDINSRISVYDSKTFDLICQTETYNPVDQNDEQKCTSIQIDSQNKIYCGYSQGNIRVYQLQNNQLNLENEYLGHLSGVKSLAIKEQDNILVTGAKDGSGRVWNKQTGEFIKSLSGHRDNVCAISFCPGQRLLATGAWDQKVMIFKY